MEARKLIRQLSARASNLAARSLRPSRLHIQAPVVEQKWRIVLRSLLCEFIQQLLAYFRIRKALEVAVQDHAGEKLPVFVGGRKARGGFFEAGLYVGEAGATQTPGAGGVVGELPGIFKSNKVLAIGSRREQAIHTPEEPDKISAAAALRDQPASGLERTEQARKELIVIFDPMKRRGTEDAVELTIEWKMLEVGVNELHPLAVLRNQVSLGVT